MLKAFQADFEFPAIICIKRNKSELFGSVSALVRHKTEENEVSPQTKDPTISNVKSLDLLSSRAGQIRTCRGTAPPSCLLQWCWFWEVHSQWAIQMPKPKLQWRCAERTKHCLSWTLVRANCSPPSPLQRSIDAGWVIGRYNKHNGRLW